MPAGSIVRYRSPGLWQEHKLIMLGSIGALLIQSLLIVGLLYQRRERRQAERDSQRHLALAADASRRQTMSALTTSIAHELGQPLSSMIHNADALRAMIDADRAPSDTMREILTDIRAQSVQAAQIIERHRAMLRSHQLQRRPIDVHAVVHESLALVAHDLKTREIQTTVELSSSPCVISGDPVLLQQVLVNLMMNAIDAMAETPKARRHLTIATAVRAADVELSVRDLGTGLPSQVDGTLFTPFVTTKPHGLGSDSLLRGRLSRRTVAPSMAATIPKGVRRSRSPCVAATSPTSGQSRQLRWDWPDDERFQQVLVCRPGWLLRALCASVEAQPQGHPHVQQILLLQGVDRGSVTVDSFTANFRVDLDARVGRPVNVVQVVVTPTGFVGAPEHAVIDYIQSTFAKRSKPELIVTAAGPAAAFARKYRQQLFPDTPLVFAAVDQRFLGDAPLEKNETAVAVANDFAQLVDDILRLLPRTKQVFVVTGSGPIGRFWRRELGNEFQRFRQRLTFVWSDNLSLAEILRRSASLPPDSAIFYLTLGVDAQGGAYADERVLADLRATANAPLFGPTSPMLGHGIVGGRLMSIGDHSRSAADAAAAILNGAPPGSIAVPDNDRHANRSSMGASYGGGGLRRAACRQAASCVIAVRACGRNTSSPCLDRSARWPSNRCSSSASCPSAAHGNGPRATAGGTWGSPRMPAAVRRCRR